MRHLATVGLAENIEQFSFDLGESDEIRNMIYALAAIYRSERDGCTRPD